MVKASKVIRAPETILEGNDDDKQPRNTDEIRDRTMAAWTGPRLLKYVDFIVLQPGES
jgi:hypothetical protein